MSHVPWESGWTASLMFQKLRDNARGRPGSRLGTATCAALTVIAVTLAACGGGVATDRRASTTAPPAALAPIPTGGALEALEAARLLWAAAGLDTYRYMVDEDCGECAAEGSQEVVIWGGDRVDPDGLSRSVEEMFDRIEQAILEGLTTEIIYDPELGYPVDVAIDMEQRPSDGGTRWTVQDLEPGLPGDPVSLPELLDAQQLWLETKPEAYEYTLTISCECELAGSIRARVDRIAVTIDRDFTSPHGEDISAISMDDVFSDLIDMLSSADGVVEDGVRFQGSARYDEELGIPTWIGLDITVVDDSADLAYLPDRLVFVISDFEEVEPETTPNSDPDDAAAALLRWREAGIDDYEYELFEHDVTTGTFSDPYIVTVRDGAVASVTSNGEPVSPTAVAAHTVDGFFAVIELWRQQGNRVETIFQADLGYPVLVAVQSDDPTTAPLLFISIHDLVPLP